jgi:hypothetical protein
MPKLAFRRLTAEPPDCGLRLLRFGSERQTAGKFRKYVAGILRVDVFENLHGAQAAEQLRPAADIRLVGEEVFDALGDLRRGLVCKRLSQSRSGGMAQVP